MDWVKEAGAGASEGSFADAAGFAQLIFHCTKGTGSLEALRAAGAANLAGKVLIDITNPLGMPASPAGNMDSLGETIQREFPDARVVKTLNTVNCNLMVDARRLADGDHDMFVAGNDAGAKAQVVDILKRK